VRSFFIVGYNIRMVILGTWNGKSFTISVKENCLTVSLPGEAGSPEQVVLSYDYAGRPWTALEDGISYRRGLDGKHVAKWGSGELRQRRWLGVEEGLRLEERLGEHMLALYNAIQGGQARLEAPLPPLGVKGFERALAFDAAASQADAVHYRRVYQPVGILPPDQYFSVVLQVTEGCSFNTCTFCTFYRDRPFRIKTPEALTQHAQAVKEFIGAGMSLRRTLFLGDANALAAPMPRLLSLVDVVRAQFDVEALGGMYAFLDGFSGERKSAKDYAALAERGLKRVYIGLESGHEPLLKFLKKPGTAAEAVQAVKALKAGGVAVGIILLLGAGGQLYAKKHVQDSLRALNAMPLDLRDLVYFSELVEQEGMPYTQDAFQAHLQPLDAAERVTQGEAIQRGLKFSRRSGTPHMARYDIREFVY
jgi:hypothetical protein